MCLTDNRVQNRPWGNVWGNTSFERGRFKTLNRLSRSPTFAGNSEQKCPPAATTSGASPANQRRLVRARTSVGDGSAKRVEFILLDHALQLPEADQLATDRRRGHCCNGLSGELTPTEGGRRVGNPPAGDASANQFQSQAKFGEFSA